MTTIMLIRSTTSKANPQSVKFQSRPITNRSERTHNTTAYSGQISNWTVKIQS